MIARARVNARNLLAIAILCVAVGALFYRLLLGEVIFWGTPLLQFYPWQKLAFDQIRAGQIPLWNPLVGNGAPLLANYQTAVFYPPNWLHLIIPSEYAMGIIGMAHVIWAGLGMAAYLRRVGVGALGQGVGMLSFALCGYLISRFGFLSITTSIPWLPWLLWAIDGTAQSGASRRPFVLLSTIVGLQLLAGHAQTSFYSLVLGVLYALWRFGFAAAMSWRARLLQLAGVAGSLLLGAGIAAIQLTPTAELMLSSQRVAGVEPLAGLSYSFWPWRLTTLVAPNLFGSPGLNYYDGYGVYWEDALYIGLLPLIMVGHAVARWLREQQSGNISAPARVVPFYVALLPIVFVLALGRNTPVFLWLFENRIPGFVTFQAPTRWMLLAEFALCALAAVGVDVWESSERGLYWTRLLMAGGFAVFAGSFIAVNGLGLGVRYIFVPAMLWLGAAVIAFGVAGLILPLVEQRTRWRPHWEFAVLALIATDLVVAHWGLTPTVSASYYHQSSQLAEVAQADAPQSRVFYLPADEDIAKFGEELANSPGLLDTRNFQASGRARRDELRNSLLPNLGMLDGVVSSNNFDPLLVGHYDQLMRQFDSTLTQSSIILMERMNVGLLLTTNGCGPLQLARRSGMISACRVPKPWPRAVIANCVRQGDGDALVCERTEGEATINRDDSTHVSVRVSSERPATLLLLDTYYPGWKATVNGNDAPIERANVAFRAVSVPAGESTVNFTYQPVSWAAGAILSAVAIAITASLWALGSASSNSGAAEDSRP